MGKPRKAAIYTRSRNAYIASVDPKTGKHRISRFLDRRPIASRTATSIDHQRATAVNSKVLAHFFQLVRLCPSSSVYSLLMCGLTKSSGNIKLRLAKSGVSMGRVLSVVEPTVIR